MKNIGLVILLFSITLLKLGGQEISVDSKSAGVRFDHFWSKCVGAGRANEGLRASWLEQMQMAKKNCGFEYCRFHGLFHDDMFVYSEIDGKPVYNWQYIDDLFDRMLNMGVRPFVELSFMPEALASDNTHVFWWNANACPPKNYEKWGNLISEFVNHCIARYGLSEVKNWYFEVWNEPNLKFFWSGTKSQYFEIYKTSVQAIKAIDKSLRVGGPATSNFVPDDRFSGEKEDPQKQMTLKAKNVNTLDWQGVWIIDFLEYCKMEKLPVDFVSTHPYPTDFAIDTNGLWDGRVRDVNSTFRDMTWMKKTVTESTFPNAEIHLTEWSSSPSSRDRMHDFLPEATYIVKVNTDGIGLVNSLSYWTFTDVFEELGAGNPILHGGFGMINYQGLPKPAFHAYRMLNRLGNRILYKNNGIVVTKDSVTGRISAIAYHYPVVGSPEEKMLDDSNIYQGANRAIRFTITNLDPGKNFVVEKLDKDHGNVMEAWQNLGKSANPASAEMLFLKENAWNTDKTIIKSNEKGVLNVNIDLAPWNVILLTQLN